MNTDNENHQVHIQEIPGEIAAADVDDTCLQAKADWQPAQVVDETAYVVLCGELVPLNPGFQPCGDTLVNLREAFGSLQENGQTWGKFWDYQCKVTRELTFEEHLKLQFEDVLARITLEQAIEFAIQTMEPKPGFLHFLESIRDRLTFVFVTNGAVPIARPVLTHFFGSVLGEIVVYANLIEDGKFRGLHGDVGVAKGEVVLQLGDVQFFFGDSKGGDGPGAKATWDAGGHVFALGHGDSSLTDYCRTHFGDQRWTHLVDYVGAEKIVLCHLALHHQRNGRASSLKAV